jgi:hypothetical protein
LRLGFPHAYCYDFGSQDHVLARNGLDPSSLAAAAESMLASGAVRT